MDPASKRSATSERTFEREIELCRREVLEVEEQLRGGHPDVAGLCLALADWSAEIRILEEERRRAEHPAAGARGDYCGRP